MSDEQQPIIEIKVFRDGTGHFRVNSSTGKCLYEMRLHPLLHSGIDASMGVPGIVWRDDNGPALRLGHVKFETDLRAVPVPQADAAPPL